jgi:hypothetical protein
LNVCVPGIRDPIELDEIVWRISVSPAIQEDEMKKIFSLVFILLFVSTGYAATGGSIA